MYRTSCQQRKTEKVSDMEEFKTPSRDELNKMKSDKLYRVAKQFGISIRYDADDQAIRESIYYTLKQRRKNERNRNKPVVKKKEIPRSEVPSKDDTKDDILLKVLQSLDDLNSAVLLLAESISKLSVDKSEHGTNDTMVPEVQSEQVQEAPVHNNKDRDISCYPSASRYMGDDDLDKYIRDNVVLKDILNKNPKYEYQKYCYWCDKSNTFLPVTSKKFTRRVGQIYNLYIYNHRYTKIILNTSGR